MTFFNIDPNIKRFPPEKVRFKSIEVKPYDDGRRIQISIELTPFLERPVIELEITDDEGNNYGNATIVEPPFWKQGLTMHIKKSDTHGMNFLLEVRLVYPDTAQPVKKIKFNFPQEDQSNEIGTVN